MCACARRWRTSGSSSAPALAGCSRASSTSWVSERRILRWKTKVHIGPRSCATMPMAMPQPAPGVPRRFVGRHAHVLEEHLAELGVVGHLAQRTDGDAGRLHVDEQQADALVLRRVGLGAAEEEAPVGDVGVAGPHLLAVHDVVVAVTLRPGAERRQIGARAGLGEALTPELVAVHHRAQEALALRLAAVLEERGADQVDVGLRRRARRADLVEGLIEEPALHHGRAAAAVLARPRDGGPAAVEEPLLPLARDLDPERVLDPRPAVVAPPRRRGGCARATRAPRRRRPDRRRRTRSPCAAKPSRAPRRLIRATRCRTPACTCTS